MIDTPEIIKTSRQAAATIRFTIPRDQIQQVMGPAIQEVMATVAAQGIKPAGPLFSHHFRMDPGVFDFEVGVPVSEPVAAAGRVLPGELPAATVLRTIYHGDYEGLGPAWGEFGSWAAEHGYSTAQDLWECYVTGPESGQGPAGWQTELNRPLAGGAEAHV